MARAEDKPAPASTSGESSITSAKKGFDTIKALREAELQAKGDGLKVTVPTMETDPSGTPGAWLRAQRDKEKELVDKKKKSANWLLEAMEKDHERKPDGEMVRSSEVDTLHALNGGERTLETSALGAVQPGAADDKVKEKPAAPQVVNPLTRFMSDWMTPKDYSLLQSTPGVGPAKDGSIGSAAGAALPEASASAGLNLPGVGGGLEPVFGNAGASRTIATGAPRENPFLQALGPLPSASPVNNGFTPPTPASLPPISSGPALPSGFQSAPAPEIAPVRQTVPDFARPAIDDKAFKPMKRF